MDTKVKTTRRKVYDPEYYDDEEREIMEEVKRGVYVPASNLEQRKKELKQAAINTLKKKPITIRVQQLDIMKLKQIGEKQGIPYQTLISSILHRYATGRLKGDA
jgi:predicted DNA binding CopG/RHH family protein